MKIALEARDDYGSFLAFGISTLFGVQALVNLAVAMAILPTKGLTLPVPQLRRLVAAGERGGGGHPPQHHPAAHARRAETTPCVDTGPRRARRRSSRSPRPTRGRPAW